MDAKETFKKALARVKEALSRQPISNEVAAAAKRERWSQTVTPVRDYVDWLKTQKEKQGNQEFGFGGGGVELSEEWSINLFVVHRTRNDEGDESSLYTHGIMKIVVTPANATPFCWSTLDQDGLYVVDTHCHEQLQPFLNEVAEYAAQAFAVVQQERLGRTRQT